MLSREELEKRIAALKRQEMQALAMANQAAGAIAALEALRVYIDSVVASESDVAQG